MSSSGVIVVVRWMQYSRAGLKVQRLHLCVAA